MEALIYVVSPLGSVNVAAHPAACNSESSPRSCLHPCSSPPDQRLLRERLRAAYTTVVSSFCRKLPCCSCVRTSATTAAVLAWAGLTAQFRMKPLGRERRRCVCGWRRCERSARWRAAPCRLSLRLAPQPGSPCESAPLPQRPCAPLAVVVELSAFVIFCIIHVAAQDANSANSCCQHV